MSVGDPGRTQPPGPDAGGPAWDHQPAELPRASSQPLGGQGFLQEKREA